MLSLIAQIGFPAPASPLTPTSRKRRTLKGVVLTVCFVLRVEYVILHPFCLFDSVLLTESCRRSKQEWQAKREVKDAVVAALEDVRRNRPVPAPKKAPPAATSSHTNSNAVAGASRKDKGKQRAVS